MIAPRHHRAVAAIHGADLVDAQLGDVVVVEQLTLLLRPPALGMMQRRFDRAHLAMAMAALVRGERRCTVAVLMAREALSSRC